MDKKPFRSEKYLNWVRQKKCLVCRRPGVVPHHEALGQAGWSRKPPDTQTVPLCECDHGLRHDRGKETFWKNFAKRSPEDEIIRLLVEYIEEILVYQEAPNKREIIHHLTECVRLGSDNDG